MNGMGSEEGDISCTPPGIETTEDSAEAAKSSADSTELPRPRRGSARRVARAVTSVDCGSVAEAPARVLRARGAAAGRVSDAKDAARQNKPTSTHSGRGTPARSRSRNIPVMRPEMKKSTAKTASKHTLGTTASPKLSSRSRKGNGGPLTQAPCTTPAAAACKPEAETEASTCGEEIDYSKGRNEGVADAVGLLDEDASVRGGSNDLIGQPETKTVTPKHHAMLQHKEVKEEESEKEEENIGVKSEEYASRVGPGADGVHESTEPPRKRGRQQKDDKAPRLPKRRKKPPVQYVRCEMEGCGTVLAHPRYLQHHIKYQHLLKKKYVCDHPSCGRLFRLQKQLMRHAKHHTDQRDYICEYCARAFKSAHNLAVHRMIHTGEKPIQCEICGFTCRQKASLNWHMKKHDAEATYQFSCSICSKRFEKKDSVVAHKAKSHPEVLIAEALAANGGSVISSPTPITGTVPVLTQPDQPTVSPKNQEAATGTLAAVQQAVHLVSPQTQIYASPGQFLQLPVHHVVRGEHQQQAPNLLHVSSAPHAQLTNIGHPQLIQLSTIPTSNFSTLPTADPQSTLLTLSTVTTLASTASLGSQQAVQWGKETHEDTQLSGEGELWDRVVVGEVRPDVGEMMWEGNRGRRKEDEGIEWERDGERDILLQSAEDQGDHLM